MPLDDLIEKEFSLKPGLIYLNHAAVGPWPTRTADAVRSFATENELSGAQHYLEWMKTESALRDKFAQIINAASSDDIAILKNTSEALSFVAYGLDWQAGDNIVISNQEFPSNAMVWHSLKDKGVQVREIDLSTSSTPERALINALDKNTKLLSISSVQYATGLKMNLAELGSACKKKDILFCIDAIQSIGAHPFDIEAYDADFVMADTHKWMLGPEGVALFYCRPALREKLKLHEYGWHMLEDVANYTTSEYVFSKSARRFECGSPNMLGIHGANASLSLLLEIGLDKVEERLLRRSQYTIEQINNSQNLTLITNQNSERVAGIITFQSSKIDSQSLYQKLMKNNVICAPRGGGVRFSPHFYTALDDINAAVHLAGLTG